jgi:holo-[acyl-carrier protein] synthase
MAIARVADNGQRTVRLGLGELSLLYLGTDLVHIPRIRAALDRFGPRFLQRVYTPAEQRVCWRSVVMESWPGPGLGWGDRLPGDVVNRLAGRWAAKEAIVKALGTGWEGVGYRDVAIDRLPTGEPLVQLTGRAIAALDRRLPPAHRPIWQVSFSHDRDYAIASAVLLCWPANPG